MSACSSLKANGEIRSSLLISPNKSRIRSPPMPHACRISRGGGGADIAGAENFIG